MEIDEVKQQQDVDKIGNNTSENNSNVPCMNIIIHPQTSGWLSGWKGMVHIAIFAGFFINPIHIGFTLGDVHREPEKSDKILSAQDFTQEQIIDIIVLIDILFTLVTAF